MKEYRHSMSRGLISVGIPLAFLATAFAARADLPEGYEQLPYIRANGAQYIDSGYTPQCTDIIEMKVQFSDISTDQNLFCARDSNYANTYTCWLTGKSFRFDRNTGKSNLTGLAPSAGYDYVVRMDGSACRAFVNGHDQGSLCAGDFTVPCRWFFFVGACNGSSSFTGYGKQICYYVKVWNRLGELILDFKPARRTSDGALGLYETVKGEFHGNASGSGAFTTETGAGTTGAVIANWPFGDKGFTDTSANAYTLTAGSGVTLEDGYATFDGTSAATLYSAKKLALSSAKAITAECWLKFKTAPSATAMFLETSTEYNSNNGAFLLDYDSASNQKTFVGGVRSTASTQGYALTQGSTAPISYEPTGWHHLVFVMPIGAAVRMFIDGAEYSNSYNNYNKTLASSFAFVDNTLYVGRRNMSTYVFTGNLDDIRLTARALTASEIRSSFVAGLAEHPVKDYYLCDSLTTEPGSSSSISGTDSSSGQCWGWSTMRNTARDCAGMLAGRNYFITLTSGTVRTPENWVFCGTPETSTVTVEEGATFCILNKQADAGTLTLNNLTLEKNAILEVDPGDDNRRYIVRGDWNCATGSVVRLVCAARYSNDLRRMNLGATMKGTGTIAASLNGTAGNYARTEQITGNLQDWSGSLKVYGNSLTLELATATALPKDDPDEPSAVVVTNGATLSVLADWTSGVRRAWCFGSNTVGKVSVGSGRTVTILGDIDAPDGFYKKGAGTLVLADPRATPRAYAGECFVAARELEEYYAEIAADTDFYVEAYTNDFYYEGTACTPEPVVRLRTDGSLLTKDADYAVSYEDNAQDGMAHAVVTGLGSYEGQVLRQKFRVHDLSKATFPYGVRLLEYVQFTGSQYVSTGVTPTDHQIEVRYYTTTYVRDGHVFGTDYTSSAWNYLHWTEYDSSNNRTDCAYYWGYNNAQDNSISTSGLYWRQAMHDLLYNSVSNHAIVLDGQLLKSGTESLSQSTLYIGRRSGTTNYRGNIYSFKITDRKTGEVVCDLLPAKTSDGTACFVDRLTGGYYMPSGTLTAGPVVYEPYVEPPDIPVSGATYHLDASRQDTMKIVTENGIRYVTRWNHASGGTRYVYSGWNSSIGRPYLSTRDGVTFMDYGPGKATGYGGGHAFSAEDTSIREVFMVFSDYPGTQNAGFLLGDYYNYYSFHRGATRGALFNGTYAAATIRGGKVQIDGNTVSYDTPLSPGFHVIRVQTTGATRASRLAVDRDTNGNGWGGELIAEAVIYDKVLTDDQALQMTEYLQQKWAKLLFRVDRKGEGVPGLRYRMFSGWNTTDDWTPTTSDPIVPGALLACCTGGTYNDGTYSQTMGEYHNWSYKGAVYMRAGCKWCYTGYYDDGSWVYITPPGGSRQCVMGNNNDTSYTPPVSGWYTIDVRVGNHNGGVGPAKAPHNTASQLGAGVAWNTNGVTSCTTSNYASWRKFINKTDDVFLYTDEPSVTLYGKDCFWTGGGSSPTWSESDNWADGLVPEENGCDTVYIDSDAAIDFSGANIYKMIHRGGALTVSASSDPLVIQTDFISTGSNVTWAADTFLNSGTHVFSNACPFVCAKGFRMRGNGSLTKTGPGFWTIAGDVNTPYSLEGTLRILEGTVNLHADEKIWVPSIHVYGPTAQLILDATIPNALNLNTVFYLGETSYGGRFKVNQQKDLQVYQMYLLNKKCANGAWRPYPWGMETGDKCWPDIYGKNVTLTVYEGGSATFTPLGAAHATGRQRTWLGTAGDDDPDNPANWKEGVPAWYCDDLTISVPNAPPTIRTMEFHNLLLEFDWTATSLTLWGALHVESGYLYPAAASQSLNLAGDWMHTIDGRCDVVLGDGFILDCEDSLTIAGNAGVRFPSGGACVQTMVVGDLILTGGGRLAEENLSGLSTTPFPYVTNVVVTGVGSRLDFEDVAPFKSSTTLEIAEGARVRLGSGVDQPVTWFKTDSRKRPGRYYTGSGSTGTKLPRYLLGEGTVHPAHGGMGLLILGHGE